MAFDAGTIRGKLDLDHTNFDHGIHESHTHAEDEGGRIREVFETIAETLNEVAGPAFARFGEAMQSAFAGFSEGPALGTLNLLALSLGNVREAVEGTGARFHQLGLEAEKAGVSTEFLARLSSVGSTVGVSIEQLGLSFKTLEERAAEAHDGNKATIADFDLLGISAEQCGQLMKDPQKLFEAVQESLRNIPGHADRLNAALHVMGNRSSALGPLLAMNRDEFDKTADVIEKLQGKVTESDAKMGLSFGNLEADATAAWNGIELALSKPVLKYIDENLPTIQAKLIEFSKGAVTDLGEGWKFASDHMDEFKADGAAVIEFIKNVTPMVEFLAKGIGGLASDLAKFSAVVANDINGGGGPITAAKKVDRAAVSGLQDFYYDAGSLVGLVHDPRPGAYNWGAGRNPVDPQSADTPQFPPQTFNQQNSRAHQLAYVPGSHPGEHAPPGPTRHVPATGNTTNHYHVRVHATADAAKTAAALAPVIKAAIDKAQKSSDQKTAGAVSASAVSQSMGS